MRDNDLPHLLHPDAFLSPLAIDEAVQRALAEDLGRAGDITSLATIPERRTAHAVLIARASRRDRRACRWRSRASALSPDIDVEAHVRDGAAVAPGVHVLTIPGPARALLAGERTALNFLGRLSGIATLTRAYVRHTAGTQAAHLLHAQDHAGPARAREIRRALRRRHQPPLRPRRRDPDQGQPHRGRRRRRPALERARRLAGHLVKIEIEVDRLEQLARRSTPASPTSCCSTIWTATMREAVRRMPTAAWCWKPRAA